MINFVRLARNFLGLPVERTIKISRQVSAQKTGALIAGFAESVSEKNPKIFRAALSIPSSI
jgi:hypothetical protein